MPGIITQQPHSHKSTTKSTQKPFKSRFTSKNELRDRSRGRLDKTEKGVRRTYHQHVMSKFDRKNHAKQIRQQKNKEHEDAASIFKGKDGAPRVVAVVPLCNDVAASVSVKNLNNSLDVEDEVPDHGSYLTSVDRFKTKIQYLNMRKDLFAILDACQIADFVLFVLSSSEEVDEQGELILRSVETQGISNVYFAVQGLESIDAQKHRQQTLASLKSFTQHFFPSVEKIHSLDNRQDCLNVVRSLCTTTPKGIRWRDDRSWMHVEDIQWPSEGANSGEVTLTGVVRGQRLKADRLVHVGELGDFQINSINAAPRAQPQKGKANAMSVDGTNAGDVLDQPSSEQDTLEELAPEDIAMDGDIAPSLVSEQKGVLLDDQHYCSGEDEDAEDEKPRRMPKGTSKYQSAWYLGENSDSGSDMEDVEDWEASTEPPMDDDVDGMMEGVAGPSTMAEDGASEYPETDMDDAGDDDEAEELAVYRAKRRKNAAEDDREFPDEIELHPDVLARERLSKYRGLKSPKTSNWNTEADRLHQPQEWDRLLDISDYKGAKSKVLRESLVGGVKPGTRVSIQIKDVPVSLQKTYDPSRPLPLFSLLRHEHKRTCVNVSITLKSDAPQPIKSKEELLVQIGPRRFLINPLFSTAGNTPNDVHKFERYLHPGRTAVASFIAPITWGSVPVMYFQKPSTPSEPTDETAMDTTDTTPSLSLIAHGTTLPPSTTRIIAKRALLTGQPYKIHKKLVTIRYMFFNAEDVNWFKALQLWTNRGRQGTIKESLGTHGYFKAVFDGRIGPMDAVGISLWKRMWPRQAREVKAGEVGM